VLRRSGQLLRGRVLAAAGVAASAAAVEPASTISDALACARLLARTRPWQGLRQSAIQVAACVHNARQLVRKAASGGVPEQCLRDNKAGRAHARLAACDAQQPS